MMTYRELLAALISATPEQLDCTVSISVDDEIYAATLVVYTGDVLDPNHLLLVSQPN
jgi:hypothetical protein